MNATRDNSRIEAEQKMARSREELEGVLIDEPLDPAFPRSRTMRLLSGNGPLLLAGVALGLMVLKPRWGRKVIRLLPTARLLKRMNRR